MDVDITIKNYRCFADSSPARLELRGGFTALLGVNNSGKSSLLKFFYEFRGLFDELKFPQGNNLTAALRGGRIPFRLTGVTDSEEVFANGNARDLTLSFARQPPGLLEVGVLPVPAAVAVTIPRGSNTFTLDLYLVDASRFDASPANVNVQQDGRITRGNDNVMTIEPFLDFFRDLTNSLYIGPFRNAVNVGTKDSYYDISIGQAFVKNWRSSKTGNNRKQNEAAYHLTQDLREIFGFDALEINPSPEDDTLQVFVDGKSYRLNELGAGLAQFIVVLASAAVKWPAFILIDEPELNLHPSLQVEFLTALGAYARRGVLFATHSYGLARACAEQVYTLRKTRDGGSDVRPLGADPRLPELLGELSFSGYREMGFEKVLLVEGPTEVKAVQQLLRLYKKDHRVVLLPLGGTYGINGRRTVELEELNRISPNKVHALIDSDVAAPTDTLARSRQEFVESCKAANISVHVLKRRAFENYLADEAVKRVKGDKYTALGPYEKLGDLARSWSKDENWRIAREMSLADLEGNDLGEFLADL
jgi:ABC-type cobalamin/Fe3+-siderophores transport system ATPase subunit